MISWQEDRGYVHHMTLSVTRIENSRHHILGGRNAEEERAHVQEPFQQETRRVLTRGSRRKCKRRKEVVS